MDFAAQFGLRLTSLLQASAGVIQPMPAPPGS